MLCNYIHVSSKDASESNPLDWKATDFSHSFSTTMEQSFLKCLMLQGCMVVHFSHFPSNDSVVITILGPKLGPTGGSEETF